jgi:hypothetical protein
MDLLKSLETIKAVCDDAIANGRFKSMDDAAAVTEAYNNLVMASNVVVGLRQQQAASAQTSDSPAPTEAATQPGDAAESEPATTDAAPAADGAPAATA